ncbi:MAG: hypothetical protein Q9195_006258 [Heterodermia aff. obscurata]
MGAIIAVLAFEDGKQVDQWGFRITPNAVVSFIATLAKSSLLLVTAETIGQLKWLHYHGRPHELSDMKLFDEASRGPLGSLKLLISKDKSKLLTSIAAIIVLGALFVDPFVQYTMPSNQTLDGWLMSPAPAHTMWNSSAAHIDLSSSMNATFAQIEAIQLSDVITAADGTQMLPSPKASKCSFAFCTKTYKQIDVTNGVLGMPTPEESILMLGSRSNESCLPSTCTTPFYQTMVSQSPLGNRSNYSINYADREYITDFLMNMFNTGWGDLGLSDVTQYGRPLAYSQDLNQTIKSIAASMTEVIRTGPNSTTEVGVSYVERTFIVIRWSYLAYPIALVLLTSVVLIAVIIETTRHGVIAWKNSALALVFHELKGWEMPAPKITNVQELDRLAVSMKGILVDGGGISAFTKKD